LYDGIALPLLKLLFHKIDDALLLPASKPATSTRRVDPFVTQPLRSVVHDFGARSGNPALIAAIKLEAAAAAAYFEFV
jgi:hypothetical protein